MSKRVLVTGGAGFISSNFIRHLLDETEHEVVTLDALTYAGNLENLADVMSHPRLSFVHGDVRDVGLVRELIEGVDVIINAAAESHVEKSIEHGASEFVSPLLKFLEIGLPTLAFHGLDGKPDFDFLLLRLHNTQRKDDKNERNSGEQTRRTPHESISQGGSSRHNRDSEPEAR